MSTFQYFTKLESSHSVGGSYYQNASSGTWRRLKLKYAWQLTCSFTATDLEWLAVVQIMDGMFVVALVALINTDS